MGKPLVSIITPSYNQADYLEQTIRSVLEQDYPYIEYMIVDGGSQDDSVEIIRKYEDQLTWWVSEPDKGQSEAINKGFQRAKGEIVAWLNSDDIYMPGAVRKAVEALEADPSIAFVYANLHSINARGEHVNTIRYRQYNLVDLLALNIIGQPTVFVRRSYLDQVGLLDTSYDYLLDHHLWLRLATKAPFVYIPQEWAAARFHPLAKNVAQAKNFGVEAYRILEWAKTQPKLVEALELAPERIWGGAHRFSARYLLDGGAPMDALKAYWKVWRSYPDYAYQHWHRIFFSLLSLIGLGSLRRIFYRRYFVSPRPTAGTTEGVIEPIQRPIHKDLPRDIYPPILVTGVHRGSTTWVGRMLSANNLYTYISEPLNILHRPGIMRFPTKHWYLYVSEENEEPFMEPFNETLNLKYHTWRELSSMRSFRDAGRMIRDWSSFTYGGSTGQQALLKDPFAVFSVKWFAKRLGCRVVIVVRHPAAFVSSLKRLQWPFEFEDLLVQPLLMKDWLEPFREEMEITQREPTDMIYQASLLWRVIYHVVWKYKQEFPDFQIVRHMDLSRNPSGEFKALYKRLGLPYTKAVEKRILRSSSSENPAELSDRSIYSTRLDSLASLQNWKQRLSGEEIDRVRDLTADVAQLYYSDKDWA
jgi:glycosyltransferase involved in cell wall biosynthesis